MRIRGAMPRPVLLFNAVTHGVLAVARSLARRGIPVTLADVTGGGRPIPSRAIRDFVRLPSHRESPERFIEALEACIRKGGHDMLVPMSDAGLAAAMDYHGRLSSLLHVGCPAPDIVRKVLEKDRTLEAAAACGIAVPGKINLPSLAELEGRRRRLRFPVIAKPSSKEDESQHAFKMRYFASFEELRDAFLVDPQFGSKNIFQEFCPGEGVGIETLIHRGQPVAIFQHRRLRELPVSGGGSVASISETVDPRLAEQAIALLRKLNWEGVAMVEFKVDRESGRAALMEVNGRYWGSIPLAIGAGIDFPFYEWQLAHGEAPSIPPSYPVGLRCRWLAGDIRRMASLFEESALDGFPRPPRGREFVRFLQDFARPSCSAIWSWSDPAPALRECRSALKIAARTLVMARMKTLKQAIAEYRYHGTRVSLAAIRLRVLYALGIKRPAAAGDLSSVRSVLFVCHGNIIRSAMGEALLRKYLRAAEHPARIEVASAGLTDSPQERADARSRAIAPEFGVSLEDHRPRRLTAELIQQADLIVVMDCFNEARMLAWGPEAMRKVVYITAFGLRRRGAGNPELGDPNLGGMNEVRQCYLALDGMVRGLNAALQPRMPAPGSARLLASAANAGAAQNA